MLTYCNNLSVKDYCDLRTSVGWPFISDDQAQGIGKKMVQECIKYIDSQLKDGWRIKIVIVASKGKETFYEKLGFKVRPNDNNGPGMDMWRERYECQSR